MEKTLIILALLAACCLSQAQKAIEKPAIDTSVLGKWPVGYGVCSISHNGNFAAYTIDNLPSDNRTLVVQSTTGGWKKEFINASCQFTSDSKCAIINLSGDSLCIYILGTDQAEYITNVIGSSLKVFHNEDWLAYQVDQPGKGLVLRNLATGKDLCYKGVSQFKFSENGQILVLQTEGMQDSMVIHKLEWLDMLDGKLTSIWQGKSVPQKYTFSPGGKELAFFVKGQSGPELWYYRQGEEGAKSLVSQTSDGMVSNLGLSTNQLIFSKDGSQIFFKLVEQNLLQPKPDAVKVDIWNYKDGSLQSAQAGDLDPRLFEAVVNIAAGKVIRLQQEEDVLFGAQYEGYFNEHVLLMEKFKRAGANANEWYWNPDARSSIILVNTRDGSRKVMKREQAMNFECYSISADGRWLVYYDYEKQAYTSYDIGSGASRNLTQNISINWLLKVHDYYGTGGAMSTTGLIGPFLSPAGIAGWQDDGMVWIYDENDIWQLDPSGIKAPVNVTNGYGRKNHIQFRVQKDVGAGTFPGRSPWLLRAFDTESKYSGFYQLPQSGKRDPEKLVMSPSTFGYTVAKAKGAAVWMVERESATEFPNTFITHDFKTYAPLSDLQPQKLYNWLTTELHHWRTPDGVLAAGILYKPENFDPHKKYPVIFNYYEQRSEELYRFKDLWATLADINIPYFVSQGYLVFVPDIHYKMGSPAESIVGCVESAAKYLSRLPFVNAKKMGLSGHSFGGYETYVLITHSHLFAAAVPAAGPTDVVSGYGGLRIGNGRFRGVVNQSFVETSQPRIGATLWQRPDLFIKNSPVFQADKATTPVLIEHGEKDDNVKFEQAIEFYTALRRLGKKVWMLQYNESDHNPGGGGASGIDMTIRTTQFFDYYLKDAPPPKWMTEGVPARLKGIETGLGLDTSGKQP